MGLRERLGLVLKWSKPLAFADGCLLIPLAAFYACVPRFIRGSSCGHDFNFHLISWLEVRRSWEEGVFFPHWTQSPNFSAGEPRFIFYPPVTWLLGGLLRQALYWDWIAMGMIFLSLTLVGLTTRALARLIMPGPNATLAGLIATAAPYALFTAYTRSALAELAAAGLIPLVMLFALRPPKRGFGLFPDGILLAAAMAGVWYTNAPAGVMASYLLAGTALTAALIYRQWWPIVRAVVAFPLALGLAADYLIPAAYEQKWIAIQQAVDVGMRISDSWLFARHAAPDLELHDQVLRMASVLLTGTAAATGVGFAIAWRRGKLTQRTRGYWIPLALLIPVIVLLQFPFSALIWSLPKLAFLQFPWRWMMVLGTPFAVFLAAATPFGSRRAKILSTLLWAVVLGGSTVLSTLLFFQNCDIEDDPLNQYDIFQTTVGVQGTDEYAPVGSDNSEIASDLPDACLVSDPKQDLGESAPDSPPVWYEEQGSCDDTFKADVWQQEHKVLSIEADQAGYLVLRLTRYPAWRVTVNDKPIAEPVQRQDGLIVLPVPAGESTVEVKWMTTPDVWWGRWVSLVSLLVAAVLCVIGWRNGRNGGVSEISSPVTMEPIS